MPGPNPFRFTGTLLKDGDAFVIPIPRDLAVRHGLEVGTRVRVLLQARKPDLSDFESLLLEWLQENHDGRDEVETVQGLIGLGEEQFNRALEGLVGRSLVALEGNDMLVTSQGQRVWDRQRGRSYWAEQGTRRMRQLIESGTNVLVCGGNRKRRRMAIEHAAINYLLSGRLITPDPPDVETKLEALGKRQEELAVAFYDAHLIPADQIWRIRSVVQSQRNIVYLFEGSNRGKMIDMVARYDAAFYQQLTIVDLDPPRRELTRHPEVRPPRESGFDRPR